MKERAGAKVEENWEALQLSRQEMRAAPHLEQDYGSVEG